MIKIPEKFWYVVAPDREGLSYMCPYEEGKDGLPLQNVAKMQETGRSWATHREYDYDSKKYKDPVVGEESVSDNIPTAGFYIGDSVSRWSTSNKLFRVKDPRGFIVEVPTGNIATLLHHTTVTKGVVQEDCVWGRDGTNHILLPVNSEPYLETLGKMDVLANKLIKKSELKVGDWVELFEDHSKYYYAGKLRFKWKITPFEYTSGIWGREKIFSNSFIYEESKFRDLLLHCYNWDGKNGRIIWVHPVASQKIVKIIKNEPIEFEHSEFYASPNGLSIKTKYDYKLIGIERKKD